MLTNRLERYRPVTCGRDENTSLGHVDGRLPAPMSRLPRPKRVVQPVAPRGRGHAARSRPADPFGSGGRRCVARGHAARSRQCVVADGVVVQSGTRSGPWTRTSQAHTPHGHRRMHVATGRLRTRLPRQLPTRIIMQVLHSATPNRPSNQPNQIQFNPTVLSVLVLHKD